MAVSDEQVVASADDLARLMSLLDDVDVEEPLITRIPAQQVVWTTAYVNSRF